MELHSHVDSVLESCFVLFLRGCDNLPLPERVLAPYVIVKYIAGVVVKQFRIVDSVAVWTQIRLKISMHNSSLTKNEGNKLRNALVITTIVRKKESISILYGLKKRHYSTYFFS